MKIKYDAVEQDNKCVAFIDDRGDICIKAKGPNDVVWLTEHGLNYCREPHETFDYQKKSAVLRFYPGDSITITF